MRLSAYEEIIGGRTDLPALGATLQGIAESLVNRPRAHGWRRGLQVPHASRLDPNWDREDLEAPLGWEILHEPLFSGGPAGAKVARHVIRDDNLWLQSPSCRESVIADDASEDLGAPADDPN